MSADRINTVRWIVGRILRVAALASVLYGPLAYPQNASAVARAVFTGHDEALSCSKRINFSEQPLHPYSAIGIMLDDLIRQDEIGQLGSGDAMLLEAGRIAYGTGMASIVDLIVSGKNLTDHQAIIIKDGFAGEVPDVAVVLEPGGRSTTSKVEKLVEVLERQNVTGEVVVITVDNDHAARITQGLCVRGHPANVVLGGGLIVAQDPTQAGRIQMIEKNGNTPLVTLLRRLELATAIFDPSQAVSKTVADIVR